MAARFGSEKSRKQNHSAETEIAQAEAEMASTRELEKALVKSKEKLSTMEAQCSALTEQRGFLEKKLVVLRKHMEKVSEREFHGGMERHRLERLLQETRAELESSAAAITAAAEAEQEAATRAKRESLCRERVESSADDLKERAVAAEAESTELREEIKRLGIRLREASEREKTVCDHLARMEESKVTAEQETGNVGGNIAEVRSELVEARRRAEEGETEVKVLTDQAATLSQEVEIARERERSMRDEIVALRGKVAILEGDAGLVSIEAKKKEGELHNELQAKDARIFELEAQMKALTIAQARLAKTRDTLVDDALQAQDLLYGAAERVRRTRSMGSTGRTRDPTASMYGELRVCSPVSMSSSLRVEDLVSNGALTAGGENNRRKKTATAAEIEGNERSDETSARGPPLRRVDWPHDCSVGTRRNHQALSWSSPSLPMWGNGGERVSEGEGIPNQRASMYEERGMNGEDGNGVTAAALDMLREVERLRAAMWELEQNERILAAKVEDVEEARIGSEAARQGAEERASSAASERDNFAARVKVLEDQLEEVQAVSTMLRERVDRAEPEVEDLKAKLRAGKDDVRRLRGQLEATGLSDSAMMGLLRGRDAALAAAAVRTSALETAKEELEARAVEAEDRQKEADRLAESVKGQLEGLGTFDRRTSRMLERATEELSHMRVQASEADGVIERLKGLLAASNAKAQSLAMELHENEKAVVTSNELLTQAEDATTAMRDRLSNVEERLKNEAKRATDAEENASSLSDTIEVQRAQAVSLERANHHQEGLLREKDRALGELQNEMEALHVQITGDSRKAKKLEEVSLSRVAETTFRFKSAAAEVETLKHSLEVERASVAAAREELASSREKLNSANAELETARAEIIALSSVRDESREVFKEKESVVQKLRAVRGKFEAAETAMQKGNEEKRELEERICLLEEEAKGHRKYKEVETEALRQHLSDAERSLADTREELAKSKIAMERKHEAFAEIEVSLLSDRKAAEERAIALASAASESAAARETALLSEMSSLRTSAEAAGKDMDEKLAVLRAEVDAGEHIMEQLKAKAAEAAVRASMAKASQEATAKEAAEAAETAARRRTIDGEAIRTLKAVLKELCAALADERLSRDGEMTEIKSVVDEIMSLHLRASGGDGDVFSNPLGISASEGGNGDGSLNRFVSVIVNEAHGEGANIFSSTNVAGMAAKLIEAYSLLDTTEARQKRLQEALKQGADRETRLREALATTEAIAEERAIEGRLLAASLQDAREGLLVEEAARREAESLAEALKYGGIGDCNNESEEESLFGGTREDGHRNARSERGERWLKEVEALLSRRRSNPGH